MGPKALIFIQSLARKSLTKGQGSGITKIPSAMQAEAKASEIFTNLVEAGLKPEMMDDFIKSEADVAKYLNILDAYKRERMKPIPADSPRGREITEALFGKRGEVVDMKGNVIPEGSGIMGGESIESLMKSGDVTKGTVTKKSKKVTDRDMFRAANERLGKPKTDVNTIIKNINRLDSIEAMKEANKIIKREGYYKNLSDKDAKKILQETEDHIFERNIKPKETDVPVDEDFATGGRVGLRYGGDTMGGKNDKSKSSPGPDRSKVSAQQERSHQEAISRARDSQQYDYTVPKQIVKDIAINTGKNLAGQKIASTLGIGTTPIGILMALKGLYDQTQNPVYSEEDLTLNSAVDKLGKTLFPEGNLQNIKATSPTQKDYNIRATKDMVENLPGGVVKDILAPAGALVMSPFYDAGQAFDRMEPGSGLRGFAKALDAENPLSSAAERFIGAAGPLAERFEDGGRVGLKGGGRTITLMDGTKVYIPEGSTTSSGGLKDRIYSSSKGDLLREDIVRLMSFESGGRVGLRGGGADFIPTEKMNTDRMKVIREFLKRKIPHLDSGPIDKSILYDLQEALSSGSGLFPGYDVRNDLPREVEAKGGGRIGLAGGMTRRAFLKLMGGVAAGIGAIKSGIMGVGKKGVAKKVVKEVIKTPPVAGKPEWFDALINKVILEGDDVTKKLATKDREIVHTKKLNDQESVTVTQDLDDGAIRVEYDSPDNLGQEPVMMQFKPGMADETTGGKKPADRFDVVETEPRYTGPDNTDIEFIGESGGPNISFIESDVTNLKTFATGKGPTMKEIVKSKKRKDLTRAVNENDYEAAEYLGGKYGDVPEPDFPDDYSGYASGGIAGMLGE
jgi:hypothetical protein